MRSPYRSTWSVLGAPTSVVAQLILCEFRQGARNRARDRKAMKSGHSPCIAHQAKKVSQTQARKNHITCMCSSLEMQGPLSKDIDLIGRFTCGEQSVRRRNKAVQGLHHHEETQCEGVFYQSGLIHNEQVS